MNILIVDDEPLIRHALERWLVMHGHRVRQAESAQAAIERLAEEIAELVILDFLLHDGVDGLGLLRLMRADPKTRGVAVVMATGLTSLEVHAHAAKLAEGDPLHGIEIIFGKPIDLPLLERAIALIEDTSRR